MKNLVLNIANYQPQPQDQDYRIFGLVSFAKFKLI
jgi:hypothetical protein